MSLHRYRQIFENPRVRAIVDIPSLVLAHSEYFEAPGDFNFSVTVSKDDFMYVNIDLENFEDVEQTSKLADDDKQYEVLKKTAALADIPRLVLAYGEYIQAREDFYVSVMVAKDDFVSVNIGLEEIEDVGHPLTRADDCRRDELRWKSAAFTRIAQFIVRDSGDLWALRDDELGRVFSPKKTDDMMHDIEQDEDAMCRLMDIDDYIMSVTGIPEMLDMLFPEPVLSTEGHPF